MRQVHRSLRLIFVLLPAAIPTIQAQDLSPAELKYFTPVRTIKFDEPDSLLIAAIEHLDVDAAGRLLVTDPLGMQVFLFDSTGALLASLDSRECHPGFEFDPTGAIFGANEFILVLNAGSRGYRFNWNGGCLGSMDPGFRSTSFMDIDPTGTFFGVEEGPFWEVRRMNSTGKILDTFPVPEPKFPNASIRWADGGLVADGSHVYYAWAPEPAVMKFTVDGRFIRKIQQHSRYFQSPRADLPAELSPELFAAIRKWRGTSTRTVFELTDRFIMLQYIDHSNGTGYQVFDKGGALIVEELGTDSRFFIHAGYGLAYALTQPDLDEEGELPNPYLTVYRFEAPQ
ncbi:MAG: hypothetical protein OXM02_13915 [Bacteroidota bacterium]|nr:hypothetical protein [Bacteroidota bacterium]MDE2957866.1 hypothetical protein [Bacteroidota bacterium]